MEYGKKQSTPRRVREADEAYILGEMKRTKRGNFADEVEWLVEFHKRVRGLFGTDDVDFIEREMSRLRKKES